MAKLRVHELAKELGIENKELMDILAKKNVEVKSHMSSLEDEVVEDMRKRSKSKNSGEEPKKKNIVQVFRPQNSKSGGRIQGNTRFQGGNRDGQRTTPSSQRQSSQGRRQSGTAAASSQRPQRPQTAGQETRRENNRYQGQNKRTEGGNQNTRYNNNRSTRPTGGQDRNQDRNHNRSYSGSQDGNRNRNFGGGNQDGNRNRNFGGNQDGNRNRSYAGNQNRNFGGRGTAGGQRPAGGAVHGQERRDNRRNDKDAIPTPLVEQKKVQRNKAKDKEKDYKKKEYKDHDFGGRGKKGKRQKNVAEVVKPQPKPVEKKEERIKQIVLPEVLTIKELADKMKVVPSVIVKKLFLQGKVVTVNQEIDYDTAEEIAMEFDVLCEKEEVVDVIEELLKEDEEDESKMVKRPPVVCVMGHVDHGKTSLLDAIRHTNVIGREAGGITQHIGAYVVEVKGEKIAFLDTPGHEAFTAMRMRGANSTDIAILVVAADDGVMPQTIEAINHAKAAGIEIIVAINKIDKPSANIDRVKQELAEYELIPEDWGGSTIFVPVSAHTKEGIPELLEMILLTAEVMELKANPDREARGLVIEAELDKGKGSVATVLVQKGTLHVGDAIAAGSAHGKVRAMTDDKGRRVKEAGPSQPVEILGLNDVPNAGEVFVSCETEKEARSFADTFIAQNKVKLLDETKSKMSLDDLFNQIKVGNLKELNIVVKADVQGSVEALKQSLLKLSNDEVVIKIIHGGVGAINESDVILASASNAIIIGFNVRPDVTAKEIADSEGVDLRLYRVIYSAIEDVEAAMKGMLDPVYEEKVLGHAEVRQTFKASGVGTIAGSYVQDGTFERGCSVRLTRDGIVIFDGPLASLKRFKDDVKEVRAGYECGFVFENFNDIKEGDLAESYKMVEIERK
ncbi:translation initiation factor IF-2 [Clostridium sp. C105KSO13]|uniref:translation initiation factor IF-2 n=1 Tax=Clostridium sp. C105KSO13 TaxID=1776045 RepID=UPI0007407405|nr:translation initiation factor IF-2 [Clostridium sp. C105KSO13]CUX42573.1 Translation initiation factor IF-2 [Clostridium sp. C105KSO13]